MDIQLKKEQTERALASLQELVPQYLENTENIILRIKKLVQHIPSVSYYTVPLHLQPVFHNLGHEKGDFPVAEKVADQCLSLPMSPYLDSNDQNKINKEILNLIR